MERFQVEELEQRLEMKVKATGEVGWSQKDGSYVKGGAVWEF